MDLRRQISDSRSSSEGSVMFSVPSRLTITGISRGTNVVTDSCTDEDNLQAKEENTLHKQLEYASDIQYKEFYPP